MNIGIVGLGLIGGSMAKAYKKAGAAVLGCDRDRVVTDFAKMAEAIDGELDESHFRSCDVIFLAITPHEAVKWLTENAPGIPAETLVIDCCGTKRLICDAGFSLSRRYGFTFVGGHPMAGRHRGGFKNSRADLFKGASMALVPEKCDDILLLERLKKLFTTIGFERVIVTTAEKHDEIIAFTSQMTHLVSNAFIKSDTAMKDKKAIAGGSYRDFTRVAYLNEDMWTELFIENRDNLKRELDTLLSELGRYEKALEADDPDELRRLLAEGRQRKSEVEKICC